MEQIRFPDGKTAQLPAQLLIDGRWVPAEDGDTLESVNPYTQETICSVPRGRGVDIDKAVAAAKRALPGWRKTPSRQRGKLLSRLADLIERDADVITKLEVRHCPRASPRPPRSVWWRSS